MESSMEVPYKTKNRAVTRLSNPWVPGRIPRENYNSKNTCTPAFTATLFTIEGHGSNMNVLWQGMNKEDV